MPSTSHAPVLTDVETCDPLRNATTLPAFADATCDPSAGDSEGTPNRWIWQYATALNHLATCTPSQRSAWIRRPPANSANHAP